MGIWLELGIFGLVFVFGFWQLRDVRKVQEQTRLQKALEKTTQDAKDQAALGQPLANDTDRKL